MKICHQDYTISQVPSNLMHIIELKEAYLEREILLQTPEWLAALSL